MAVIEAGNIDAATLDIRLFGGFSFPLAYALRQRGVPFLFLTSHGHEHLPPDLRDERLIDKPFNPAYLVRAVQETFDRARRPVHRKGRRA